MTAPGIPRMYQSNPFYRWLYVQGVDPQAIGPFFYRVNISWGGLVAESGAHTGEPVDPVFIPELWSWPQAVTTEQITVDIDGKPLMNSAGVTFDPPMTEERHDFVARVVFYRREFDAVQAWRYRGAINEDVFHGFPIGTVLCTLNSGDEMQTPFGPRYRRTVEFRVAAGEDEDGDPIGWRRRVLDEGLGEYYGTKDDGTPDYRPIVITDPETGFTTPISEPQELNGSGRKLADGAEPYWHYFVTKRSLPFSVFGLE